MRFEIDEATRVEQAAMMEVVKKREPSSPSSRPNFLLKKAGTQELREVSLYIFAHRLIEKSLTEVLIPMPVRPMRTGGIDW